ncbi:hypothetical protein K438DRAFT_1906650 [Mycena galopus ATCC 62051]|nr:hypothetical protein K438DRAFT_1906650 [Mycena galopus ATCC 62051]
MPYLTSNADRYHLYVSYACPWATRTLIIRCKLKGLDTLSVPLTVLFPRLGSNGWPFALADEFPGAEADPLYDSSYLNELYLRADPNYASRVPVLWDENLNTVVNNESSDIMRIRFTEIDALWVYWDINNSVYRAGFTMEQAAYDERRSRGIEETLTGKDYHLVNSPKPSSGFLSPSWLRKLYWTIPAFKYSTFFDHIKGGYYGPRGSTACQSDAHCPDWPVA